MIYYDTADQQYSYFMMTRLLYVLLCYFLMTMQFDPLFCILLLTRLFDRHFVISFEFLSIYPRVNVIDLCLGYNLISIENILLYFAFGTGKYRDSVEMFELCFA